MSLVKSDWSILSAVADEGNALDLSDETLSNSVASTKFKLSNTPVSITSDTVGTDDVKAYDDELNQLGVSDISGDVVTLSNSVDANKEVRFSYNSFNVSSSKVVRCRDSAISYVETKLDGRTPKPISDWTEVPDILKQVVSLVGGSFLLVKEQGYNIDTEDMTRSSSEQIKMAKRLLDEYLACTQPPFVGSSSQ